MARPAAVVGAIALVICAALPIVSASADFFRPVRHNPADRLAAHPIDDFAYDFARRCTRHPRPGTRALEAWLARHFRGVSWGIMRCSKLNRRHYSLHAEGRALDWHLDAGSAGDRATARRLIRMLLAPDRDGNPQALARRMGVQEIIWNCTTWWAGSSFLMAERRPVSALEIKQDVEGYSEMNDDAFARRFYADRAELEALGINLKVDADEAGATQDRYFARPARSLFNNVRPYFAMADLPRVYFVIDRNLQVALDFLKRVPDYAFDSTGIERSCQAMTRKGQPCQRQPLAASEYCPSHQHLEETFEDLELPDLGLAA